MNSLPLFALLLLAACGGWHIDPCVKPCPETIEPDHCDCHQRRGGDGPKITAAAPPPAVPAPKPETPKAEKPKHHDHKGKWHGDKRTWKRAGGEDG